MTDTEITQADRIAAKALWDCIVSYGPLIDDPEDGRAIGHSFLRALAKHRLAARNEALAEAAKEIVAYCREMNAAGKEASFADVHRRVLALTASQGGEEGQGHSSPRKQSTAGGPGQ